MHTHLEKDKLKSMVTNGQIDTILICMIDMQGRLIGKRFNASFLLEDGFKETHACNYLLANDIDMEPVPGYKSSSWERGYGDFILRPDLTTLRHIPWLPCTALVLCDVVDHHQNLIPHSPRSMLQNQVKRLAERGIRALCATELEFYLFDESLEAARSKCFRNLKPSSGYREDYLLLQTGPSEKVMRQIRQDLRGAGIVIEATKGEWGQGQHEINLRYTDALEMADLHVLTKNATKEISANHNMIATFLSKITEDQPGSASHIHMSLWDANGPLFLDPTAEYGMSSMMRSFVAGQLEHARELTWFLAPYVNSYKRFIAGSFAPTRILWSRDNRTAGFRMCGEGERGIRIECRIGGSDFNPYLAFAALLAAGMDGIDRKLSLPPPSTGDAYQQTAGSEVPRSLREATEALDTSTFLRTTFGDDVIDHYVHTARWEQSLFDRTITDWELMRGFERY